MTFPEDLLYTATHEWVRIEGNNATVGISDHAQSELGDVVYVELPEAGRTLAAKESAAVIESVKAASDIYSPISGTVVETNSAASADPAIVNRAPYTDGWLFRLEINPASDLSSLLKADQYAAQVKS